MNVMWRKVPVKTLILLQPSYNKSVHGLPDKFETPFSVWHHGTGRHKDTLMHISIENWFLSV